MTNLQLKLRLIFLPFIIIAIVFIPAYTFLNWYVVLYKEWLSISEGLANFFIPFVLPLALVWPLMWRRVKLLIFKNRNGKSPEFAYICIAWATITFSTVIAQEYITTATGKLTKLQTIDQIAILPKTKYYAPKKYFVSKNLRKVLNTSELTGKHNNTLTWHIYVVCPIFTDSIPYSVNLPGPVPFRTDSLKLFGTNGVTGKTATYIDGKPVSRKTALNLNPDAIGEVRVYPPLNAVKFFGKDAIDGAMDIITKKVPLVKPIAWLCLHYTADISNKAPLHQKDSAYNVFRKNSYIELMYTDLNKFDHLDRIGNNTNYENYKSAVNKGYDFGDAPVILVPVFEPYEKRNGNKLAWVFGSFGIGAGVCFLLLLKPKLNRFKADNYINA